MRYLFLFSLLIISVESYSQDSFQDFILLSSNDTVYGHIRYKNNAQEIRFLNSAESKYSVHNPSSIKGFSFEGRLYQSIQDDKVGSIFALALVLGEISLYSYKDLYFLVKDKDVQRIEKRNTLNNQILDDKRYIGQFLALMSSCQSLVTKIQKLRFSPSEFIDLVSEYNNSCAYSTSKAVYLGKKNELRWERGFWASVISNDMKYSENSSLRTNNNFIGSYTYNYGVFANIYLLGNLSIQPELIYVKKEASITSYLTSTWSIYELYSISFVQLPISLRYQLNYKLTPYFSVGLVNGRVVKNDSYKLSSTSSATPSRIDLNQSEIGYKVGLGLSVPIRKEVRIGIEYQFEKASETVPKGVNRKNFIGNSLGVRLSF